MKKPSIKKVVFTAALSLALSLQLAAPAFAATDEEILAASQAGVDYLSDNQGVDGNVTGFGGEHDWAVVAVAASGQDPATFSNGGASAVDAMTAAPLTPAASATDVEKRVLAVVAAGEDTTDFDGVNYNELLAGYHNNDQIGEETLLNDDIFGVIAITAADDAALEDMAQDGLDYFVAHQAVDGGFSYTTVACDYCGSDSNDTAAAIIAMNSAESFGLTNVGLTDAKDKAVVYLLSTQQVDGGFAYDIFSPSDGSSTAWGLMALNSIGVGVETQALAARDWLLANQNADGGFSYGAYGFTDSDTYTTAHAVIALLGSTWLLNPEPLQPAPQPTPTPDPTPAPTPTPTPTPTTTSTPVVQAAQIKTAVNTQTANDDAEVLSDQTATTEAAQDTPKATETKKDETASASNTVKDSNYTVTALVFVGLVLVAVAWFVLQSKSKQAKS